MSGKNVDPEWARRVAGEIVGFISRGNYYTNFNITSDYISLCAMRGKWAQDKDYEFFRVFPNTAWGREECDKLLAEMREKEYSGPAD